MSKYKVKFWCDTRVSSKSIRREIIDLVEDYGYTEEEAKRIYENEDLLLDLFIEWKADNIDDGYERVEE